MGTRADFYYGRGDNAQWLGSIAWDGYPDGIDDAILKANTPEDYRAALVAFFAKRDDVTLPEDGWPWPWTDSHTTDYAYAFDGGKVWACPFGYGWLDPLQPQPEEDSFHKSKTVAFPDMTERQNVTLGKRSGLMFIGPEGPIDDLP